MRLNSLFVSVLTLGVTQTVASSARTGRPSLANPRLATSTLPGPHFRCGQTAMMRELGEGAHLLRLTMGDSGLSSQIVPVASDRIAISVQ